MPYVPDGQGESMCSKLGNNFHNIKNNNNEILKISILHMASVIVIPIVVVAVVGLLGYLIYKFLIYDMLCKRNVDQTLKKYNITKSPSQIIKEYHDSRGKHLSHREIQNLEKNYRQNEPDQFLAMYDSIRDRPKNKKNDSTV